jgi:FimV-like protein
MVGVQVQMISTKIKHSLRLLGLISVFLSASSQAIVLGQIQLASTLLQPLQLRVDLIEVEGVLPGSMAAKVAGPAQFLAAGLDYQPWYSALDVRIIIDDEGSYFVQVSGQQPVDQKQLDFIFEVDYLGGRLIAEYAVELPDFVVAQKSDNQPVKSSVGPSQVEINGLAPELVLEETIAQLEAPKNVIAETETEVEAEVEAATIVVVKPGQTLWRIAVNNSPKGISPWQTLMALYKVNPSAYKNGDIRQVLANSRLILPAKDELSALTAAQAKAEYDVLVPVPVKVIQKKKEPIKPAAVKPDLPNAQQIQFQEQVKSQQQKLNGLASQSKVLQAQVEDLQADNSTALSQQELLAKTSENLASGVAVQKQDINSLNEERMQLEINMLTLDQQFESTQADLNQAQQELERVRKALAATQGQGGLSSSTNAEGEDLLDQGLSIVPMLVFLLVPIIFVGGLIWWIIRRGKKVAPVQKKAPEIAEKQPVTLDPLPDYNTKPSAKVADLHQGAKKMQGGMPERSFIEELLQQQDKSEPESTGQDYNSKIADDQVHLSADVEAMLSGQKKMHNKADEPVEYMSHEEEMNTKLYLALSYRDMGEVSQAQATLQEVLRDGDAEQKAQASDLLSSISKV